MSSITLLSSLLTLISLFSYSKSHTSTILSLTPIANSQLSDPWQRLNHLATSSLTRAKHLKHTKTNTSTTKLPLYPHGYGGYSVTLRFGTPPQAISFVMDTGSSLVWFPCTKRYSCHSCNFVNVNQIQVFIPKSSSSTKIIGCKNPKCDWVFPNVQCKQCGKNRKTCNQSCPAYMIQYGSGSTTGLLLFETLVFPEKTVPNFAVGCSVYSSSQPSGIAGFGRGRESLPAQMGLKRFAYCLASHRFDDKPVSSNSDLVLETGDAKKRGNKIYYTPFRKNPSSSNKAFEDYYYVSLRKITVGGVKVKAPYKYLVADSDGNGGTIVDSGTTFTFMESPVFEVVAKEFEKQVGGKYSRVGDVEKESGLRPCFNVSNDDTINLPELVFHFKGGAEMVLPMADYFSIVEDSVVCMTIMTTGDGSGQGGRMGPAIILGNYQQQNFYMEYDLENERLGFRKQVCN